MSRRHIFGTAVFFLIVLIGLWFFYRAQPAPDHADQTAAQSLEAPQTDTPDTMTVDQGEAAGDSIHATPGSTNKALGEASVKAEAETAEPAVRQGFQCFGKVVMEATGEPVAGATIVMFAEGIEPQTLSQTSQEDGSFRFDTLPEKDYLIFAEAPGLISYTSRTQIPSVLMNAENPSAGPLTLVLQPAHQTTLTVVAEETGRPVSSASVSIPHIGGSVYQADDAGRLVLTLSPEIWTLAAWGPGLARITRAVDLSSKEQTAYVLTLPPGGTITGSIRNEDEQPVADATVTIIGERGLVGSSDAAGVYQIDHVSLDAGMSLEAEHQDYATKGAWNKAFPYGSKVLNLDFTLGSKRPDVVVTGVVIDHDGIPIAGAEVLSGMIDKKSLLFTNHEGRFRVAIPPGRYQSEILKVSAEGYETHTHRLSLLNVAEPIDLKITLKKGHVLKGRVSDQEGNPLSGVMILVKRNADRRSFSMGFEFDKSKQDGRFKLEGLPRDFELEFLMEGYESQVYEDLTSESGNDLDVIMPPSPQLIGQVVDSNTDTPVSRFQVGIAAQDKGMVSADNIWDNGPVLFDTPDGRFQANLSKNKKYIVTIAAEDFPEAIFTDVTVTEGAQPQVFPIGEKGRSIAGTVRYQSGQPIGNVKITLVGYPSHDGNFSRMLDRMWGSPGLLDYAQLVKVTKTNASGAFHFENIPLAVHWALAFEGEGLPLKLEKNLFDRDDDELAALDIIFTESGVVTVDVNPEHYPQGRVFLRGDGFSHAISLKEGPEVVFQDVPAGTYTASLVVQNSMMEAEKVTLEPAEKASLAWGYDPRISLSGSALRGAESAANFTLFLLGSKRMRYHTQTDRAGRFQFDGLKSGTYSLILAGQGALNTFDSLSTYTNRISLTLGHDDYSDTFRFARYGALVGRVKQSDLTYAVLEGTFGGTQASRRRIGFSNTAFRFSSVPPGTYSLYGLTATYSESLLQQDIIMPEDGRDVDLGQIGHDSFGSLLIHFDGVMQPNCLAIFKLQSDEGFKETRYASNFQTSARLTQLPVGTWTLAGYMRDCPLAFQETPVTIHVEEEQTVETVLQTRPVARLMITLVSKDKTHLKDVTLTQNGVVVTLNGSASGEEAKRRRYRGTYLSGNTAAVNGLTSGEWHVTVRDQKNREKTITANLITGETVTVRLHMP